MNITGNYLENLFVDFKNLNVLILGDVMIDSYIYGKVDRISPEAPVPIVLINKRENMLGGAANVALNIQALGAHPYLCSVIGEDTKGTEFMSLLETDGIETSGIIRSKHRITTTKFRVIGNNSQLLRLDEEIDSNLNSQEEGDLMNRLNSFLLSGKINVIILQDYNKGVLTPAIINHIIESAAVHNIPVVVDPKKKNFALYKNVELFKPNLKELCEGLKQEINLHEIDKINILVSQWQKTQNITSIMVTLSENGVFMRKQSAGLAEELHITAHLRNIADVSGAGDTVISVASLCTALGTEPFLTAALANIAGGLVCEHVGVVPINGDQLLMEAIELLTSFQNA